MHLCVLGMWMVKLQTPNGPGEFTRGGNSNVRVG